MAISQPLSTDKLNSPDHSLMHRQIATDPSGAAQSITVDSNSTVAIPGAGANTTTNILSVTGDALTTGKLAHFISNSASTSGRVLVTVHNDHSDATGTTAMWIRQDADAQGALISGTGCLNNNVFEVTGNALTLGCVSRLYSNSPATDARILLRIDNDHTAATGAVGLAIQQDANALSANVNSLSTSAHVVRVDGDSLTTGSLGYFQSNSATANSRYLVDIINNHTDAVGAWGLHIRNDANNSCAYLEGTGVETYPILELLGDALTTGNLGKFTSNSPATNARNLVSIVNDHTAAVGTVPLTIKQDAGTAAQIKGTGSENLSNAGVWTDRTSTYADKTDITPLKIEGFIEKLKTLNMFEYRKKCEVFGNKQDIKNEALEVTGSEYPTVAKVPSAPLHKGYILDDPTTPEELISRNALGEIDGMSGTKNANFLLAVVKELIDRVEKLEAK